MDRHYLDAIWIIHAVDDQILCQRVVQHVTRVEVRSGGFPSYAQACADALSAIERDEIIEMRCHPLKKGLTRSAQVRLDQNPIPPRFTGEGACRQSSQERLQRFHQTRIA